MVPPCKYCGWGLGLTASRLKKTRLPAFLSKKKRLQYHTSCTKSSTWPTDKWTPPRFGPTPLPIIFFPKPRSPRPPPTSRTHSLKKTNKAPHVTLSGAGSGTHMSVKVGQPHLVRRGTSTGTDARWWWFRWAVGPARWLSHQFVTLLAFFFSSPFFSLFFFGSICFIRFSALAAVFFFFFSLSSTTALHYHSLRVLSLSLQWRRSVGRREGEREGERELGFLGRRCLLEFVVPPVSLHSLVLRSGESAAAV